MVNEIICLGDSITGWNNTSQNKENWKIPVYPSFLEELLQAENIPNEIINAGFDGARSNQIPELLARYISQYPQASYFLMEFGTNDFHDKGFSRGASPEILNYFLSNIRRLKELKKIPIVINQHRVYIHPDAKVRITEHNIQLKKLCKSQRVPYVDIFSYVHCQHLLYDGAHPNERGARIIADEVYRVLKGLILSNKS